MSDAPTPRARTMQPTTPPTSASPRVCGLEHFFTDTRVYMFFQGLFRLPELKIAVLNAVNKSWSGAGALVSVKGAMLSKKHEFIPRVYLVVKNKTRTSWCGPGYLWRLYSCGGLFTGKNCQPSKFVNLGTYSRLYTSVLGSLDPSVIILKCPTNLY